jgi:deoxyribodipyrimidine photo-lyase
VTSSARTLVLFTRDLRIHDHPALSAAAARGEVVPLVVLDPGLLARSPNRARFYLECLVDLDRALSTLGGRLIVRRGDVTDAALRVAREARCGAIFLTADVGPFATRRVDRLSVECVSAGIELRMFPGNEVLEPGAVAPLGREGYRVFGAYARAWSAADRRSLARAPSRLRQPRGVSQGVRPKPASQLPTAIALAPGGEAAGRARLTAFLRADLGAYGDARDRLDIGGSSRLSAYLRFGCLSPLEVEARVADRSGAAAFIRQLAWRDFFRQLLASDPTLGWVDLRPFPTDAGSSVPGGLEAWQNGMTGLPLVDAGMRQLLHEGWMHNRARMVTASFLTRRLGVPWQDGARHFAKLLIDGDTASNAGNWQWVAGTGTDPRRSRSFNPVRQARRCDPEGTYVRRWVGELSDAPTPLIFRPWKNRDLLRATGYPPPILPIDG